MQHNGISKHQRISVKYRQNTQIYRLLPAWMSFEHSYTKSPFFKLFFSLHEMVQNEHICDTSREQLLLLATLFDCPSLKI